MFLLHIEHREDLVHSVVVAGEVGIEGFEFSSAIEHTPVAGHGIEVLLSKCTSIELEISIEQVVPQSLSPRKVLELVVR
jgi:hypothetical protein